MNRQPNAFVYIGLCEAVSALDAGDPEKAVSILKAVHLCSDLDLLPRIERITEQADIGSTETAETLIDLLIGDLKTAPMKVTLYIVHSDTDTGADIEVFTDESKEREFCDELMRQKGGPRVMALLQAGEGTDAWHLFIEQEGRRQNYYHRHEVDVEIPQPKEVAA